MEWALILVSLLVAGLALGTMLWILRGGKSKTQLENEREEQQQARRNAENRAKELEKETQELRNKLNLAETQLSSQAQELTRQEIQLEARSQLLNEKDQELKARRQELAQQETQMAEACQAQAAEQAEKLSEIARLSPEEARAQIRAEWENRLQAEVAHKIRAAQAHIQEQSDKLAGKILAQAIQRCAVDHIVETTVAAVNLPSEAMKGRIIGREGRNIRAFELATGVDLIVDDTPDVAMVSCFDPIRREVARRALENLIADGRIHPARIEEEVEKVRAQLEDYLREEGEAAALEVGIYGLHPEIIRLLGHLRYRSSYGQNILQHSKEVAYAAGIMAAEIGADIQIARRAGLLHDLGKALTYEEVGTHTALGIDAARRWGEKPEVLHAMAAHHFDVQPMTLEAVLVQVADTLSAARPGARREPVEKFMQRMQALEKLVDSFPGVQKSYVIQAGREVRVMIDPDQISEDQMTQLAFEIAQKIEQELEYPGQIKVSLLRELRVTQFAR
ncbi:ribonuclease Y [bacterium (Candidatus Blackallbacteria) CG17_big_fil_post_rev_8_21_14_2_50_48_46]|uniref:Ribonuclease Y n=1 Tax=bacterium (Candidatus Blackallbacteria) CG17_big_fil_post_rev_8_21_14_2_50_48_46 TaxID=2014261 RepID=A0A2M7GBH3_9BACT|nr:MAG: ribonuclease Y [bacterium (Candidatus Blackallbacteria) CG18_big_fil_WC_8_21_14_2_50_49_26]PIW19529.1 MAG: ribonuclease Y [bacterium (Candidatus Blackallbacteria) CG17_big_fil_post_rev_8_21_14_2_50_48_46]PIW49095.1 MAG: ribonuclease Y [bacterium (Candidatus Blackallbacteria) CG13_big_fil_rev_8_21_14_2_50_49_14]